MKAAQINKYGHADAVKVNEVEKPTIQPGQVLVEVHASSLNPFDTMVREGYLKDTVPLALPVTLGGDIAGVVTNVAEDVKNVSIDDQVFGQANVVAGNSGAFAEYAATAAGQVARAPQNISLQDAASLPLVGVSALQALTEHLNLQPQQRLFIHGGSGGIGSIAIQIAKHIGAYVATTATGEAMDYVKQLGADEVVDYKTQDFSTVLQDFDAVFDTVGGDDFDKSLTILKRGGVAVSMIASADEALAAEHGVATLTQSTKVTTEHLEALTKLIEANVVTPHVGKVFGLQDIAAAFTARETGSVQGKIVIAIKP